MKKLFIDCTNGICSDMFLSGLAGLEFPGYNINYDKDAFRKFEQLCMRVTSHSADSAHGHAHVSYRDICELIEKAPVSDGTKKTASAIYLTIAKGEAKVHGATLENVGFHEVGRPRAISNIIKVALYIDALGDVEILCSDIHDGHGSIQCSHGIIPVPVPAVVAIRESDEAKAQGHVYVTDDIETELVTPSGLGILVGIGAKHGDGDAALGEILAQSVGFGLRDTGRDGMKLTLYK